MAKRSAEDAGDSRNSQHKHKRSRTGIHAALPTSDDSWRRKLEKAKDANVRRAKTRQVYAKVKARALAEAGEKPREEEGREGGEEEKKVTGAEANVAEHKDEDRDTEAMHPARREAQRERGHGDDESEQGHSDSHETHMHPDRRRNRQQKKPKPFQKQRDEAARRKAEAEARQAELERRAAERDAKRAERARQQKAMAKARRVDSHGGKNGGSERDNQRRKLGRESGVLLDRVRKLMGK